MPVEVVLRGHVAATIQVQVFGVDTGKRRRGPLVAVGTDVDGGAARTVIVRAQVTCFVQ